jgi:glycosyltransferase involved in cell wall biosynthesis
MRIAFLLPRENSYPIGGYKVIYEYANYLVKQDDVFILYSSTYRFGEHGILGKLRILKYHLFVSLRKKFLSSKWFNLNTKIREVRVLSINKFFIPHCDAYIATTINTAIALNSISSIENKKKLYFIQGFENWFVNGSGERVYETYKFPMTKIVISNWLKRIMDDMNEQAYLIPNGFDFKFFHYSTAIEQRDPFHIAYMYHTNPIKGTEVAFQAFELVKKAIPELRVTMFSAYSKPNRLPNWCDFYQQPDQSLFNTIYNEAAIYVGSSSNEGWGLTIGEAMICGCAVVCTDCKGYLEMAKNGENALVVPVGDAEKMAQAIIKLISNDTLRITIAENGRKSIQQFNWDNSFIEFRELLHSVS